MMGMAYAHSVALTVIAQSSSSGTSYNGDLFVAIAAFIIGIAIGRAWGRRSGLKQIGGAEYRNRWNTIKDDF